MNQLISSPKLGLRTIFFAHFILMICFRNYAIANYSLFYNPVFLFCIIWSAHSTSEEPLFYALGVNVCSFVFDAISISLYINHTYNGLIVLIFFLNMLLRPLSSVLIISYYNSRSDEPFPLSNPINEFTTNNNPRSSYETINDSNTNSNQNQNQSNGNLA